MEAILRQALEAADAAERRNSRRLKSAGGDRRRSNRADSATNDMACVLRRRNCPSIFARRALVLFESARGRNFFREDEWPYRRILRACSRFSRRPQPSAARPMPPRIPESNTAQNHNPRAVRCDCIVQLKNMAETNTDSSAAAADWRGARDSTTWSGR